jgi:hypothetical protein
VKGLGLFLPLLIMNEGTTRSAADCLVLDEGGGIVFRGETADRLLLDEDEAELVVIRNEGATFLAVDFLSLGDE